MWEKNGFISISFYFPLLPFFAFVGVMSCTQCLASRRERKRNRRESYVRSKMGVSHTHTLSFGGKTMSQKNWRPNGGKKNLQVADVENLIILRTWDVCSSSSSSFSILLLSSSPSFSTLFFAFPAWETEIASLFVAVWSHFSHIRATIKRSIFRIRIWIMRTVHYKERIWE